MTTAGMLSGSLPRDTKNIMLDRLERNMVENIRRHKGKIAIILDNDARDEIEPLYADERLNKDIAIALQGYYQRQNNKYYGDEDKTDL